MTTALHIDSLALAQPRLQRFVEYWRGLPKTGLVPERNAFDPTDIPDLLSTITMYDVTDDGHVRFRLIGTSLATYFGHNITGRDYLDFVAPERRSAAFQAMWVMPTYPVGMKVTMHVQTYRNAYAQFETVGLPLLPRPGQPPIVIFQSEEPRSLGYRPDEVGTIECFTISDRVFIDLGKGVPESDEEETAASVPHILSPMSQSGHLHPAPY